MPTNKTVCCDAWDEYNNMCMISRMEHLGCVFCGKMTLLLHHNGKYICMDCLKELNKTYN